jgi:DNA-binding protein H-NS
MSEAQLQKVITRAQEALRRKEASKVATLRKKLISEIKAAGLAINDVFPASGAGRASRETGTRAPIKAARKHKAKRKGAGQAKYREPVAPHRTWTGFGPAPSWLSQARKAGYAEKDLLIAPPRSKATANDAPQPARAATKSASTKKRKSSRVGKRPGKPRIAK